jgi:bla regulator protein BlaR1
MIIFIVKATLCALFFLFAYILLLEKENMHRFKRVYLLCSLILSMTIPFVKVQFAIPLVAKVPNSVQIVNKADTSGYELVSVVSNANPMMIHKPEHSPIDYVHWLQVIYASITIILLLRFGRNLASFYFSIKKGQLVINPDMKIVLINKKVPPYSFGNYIYLNKEDYENGHIAEEIIWHEQAHVNQKHSLDIIFIELLIAACWFNPVLYLYRLKIKQNHEFLADETVLKTNKDILAYQNILISIISNNGSAGLASAINYSIIKKDLL